MNKYLTPNGKEIETYYLGGNLAVRFTSGGRLPAELSGTWTNEREVEKSVRIYLASKEKDNDNKTGFDSE